MDIFKKPVFWLITALAIAFVVVLGIYQSIAISFAVLSIFVSTFFAARSLKIASESLRLTRNNIRPFLSVQPGDIKGEFSDKVVSLFYEIKNTGVLPGELINVDIAFFSEDEIVTNNNDSKEFATELVTLPQQILFPNAAYKIAHTINTRIESGARIFEAIRNGKIKTRHCIRYKDNNNEYLTIQTEKLYKINENTLRRIIISPHYWI